MEANQLCDKQVSLYDFCQYLKITKYFDYFSREDLEIEDMLKLDDITLIQLGIERDLDRKLIMGRIANYYSKKKQSIIMDWIIIILLALLFILPTLKCSIFPGVTYGFQNGMDVLSNFQGIWHGDMHWYFKLALYTPLICGFLSMFLLIEYFLPNEIQSFREDFSVRNFIGICNGILGILWLGGNSIIIYFVFIDSFEHKVFFLANAFYLNLFFVIGLAAMFSYSIIQEFMENENRFEK